MQNDKSHPQKSQTICNNFSSFRSRFDACNSLSVFLFISVTFMNTYQIRLHSVLLPANGIGFLMLRHYGMLTMFNNTACQKVDYSIEVLMQN